MPFININTNVSVSKAQETAVKTRLGKAIELIPGKSESWLMVGFEPERPMYFRGIDSGRIAFVEVSVYGSVSRPARAISPTCTLSSEMPSGVSGGHSMGRMV